MPLALQIILGLGALATALITLRKVLVPAWRWARRVATRFGAALDTLGGRPPIIDRVTGQELSPEVPPLGIVLADMSQRLDKVANVNDRLDRIEGRVDTVESAVSGLLADKWESGTHAILAATEAQNRDVIDVEEQA